MLHPLEPQVRAEQVPHSTGHCTGQLPHKQRVAALLRLLHDVGPVAARVVSRLAQLSGHAQQYGLQ